MCHSCQYERVASDKYVKHRCPKCKKPYLVSYKQAAREGKFDNYTPNHIPFKERIFFVFFGFVLMAYSFYAIFDERLIIPTKRSEIIFVGDGIPWGGFCLFTIALSLFIGVIDHYDKRDNEIYYSFAVGGLQLLGCLCILIGVIVD